MDNARRTGGTDKDCAVCGSRTGVLTCRGCKGNFCAKDATEHRHELQRAVKKLQDECKQLRKNVSGSSEDDNDSVFNRIQDWERESHDKIDKEAERARKQLRDASRNGSGNLKGNVERLMNELEEADENDGYYENNLEDWSQRLKDLQNDIDQQRTAKFEEDSDPDPLVSRFRLNDRAGSRSPTRLPNKRLSFRDTDYSSDLGNNFNQKKYSSGKHALRFRIDQYQLGYSIIFGIVSRNRSNNAASSNDPTLYGWGENDNVYIGGDAYPVYNGYRSEFQTGDVIQLSIDCDRRRIQIRNEKTKRQYNLDVDLTRCPLPWQPNVRIFQRR